MGKLWATNLFEREPLGFWEGPIASSVSSSSVLSSLRSERDPPPHVAAVFSKSPSLSTVEISQSCSASWQSSAKLMTIKHDSARLRLERSACNLLDVLEDLGVSLGALTQRTFLYGSCITFRLRAGTLSNLARPLLQQHVFWINIGLLQRQRVETHMN